MDAILFINLACVLVFAGLLVWASVNDVRVYRIPNWISLAIAAAFLPFALTAGHTDVTQTLVRGYGTGLIMLAIGFLLFTFRIVGGGDAKLLSAVGVWAGVGMIGNTLMIMGITGGLIAIL